MTFRFVHTADIHLDSPLRSLALRDPQLAELIGNATRRAFVSIIDLCLREQADALLLAGDLYDGEQTSMKTARFLAEQVRRLHEAGIHTFIVRGNHDALSKITKELTFPGETVKVFGGRAETISIERGGQAYAVAIHGVSFADARAEESPLPKFKPPVEGAVNIALLHTSLGGAAGHDPYAPCSVAELDDAGFEYWALGHIHKRSVYRNRSTIVMPGMPQGRDVGESGPKSVTLVTIADDRSIELEERATSIVEFESVSVDVDGITDWPGVVEAIAKSLRPARKQVTAGHLVARLRLEGSTPLAWRLQCDSDLLTTEAADQAFAIGTTWVEKLELACRPPIAAPGTSGDPAAELRRIVGEEVIGSAAYRKELGEIAATLLAQLPPESRGALGSDQREFESTLVERAEEGAEEVFARLSRRAHEAHA